TQFLSSTFTNGGTASTVTSYPYFFQVANASNGGGTVTDMSGWTMSPLAAGDSDIGSMGYYAFPTAGNWSYRACANKIDRNTFGSVVESNTANNCSPWTNITVSATPQNATITVRSVVCNSETDLPNWGDNVAPVTFTSTTASDYVASH